MQRNTNRTEELERLRRRYVGRGKAGKGRLLDEFCEHHGYERKYAIKLLHAAPPRRRAGPRPGPEPKYEAIQEVVDEPRSVKSNILSVSVPATTRPPAATAALLPKQRKSPEKEIDIRAHRQKLT